MNNKAKIKLGIIFTFILVGIFGISLVGSDSFDPGDEREIGYEFLNDDKVVHIWNTQDDYFFNKSSGIQFTNHFQDYWTRNVFCIGYYSGETWNKIYCADELENFNRDIHTDNLTYVNATLWKDITYGSYDLRLGINYYLGLNDENLSITIYGKNLGIDIPFDLGFAWKVMNIEVPPNIEQDVIKINNTNYNLGDSFDIIFENMTKPEKDSLGNMQTEYISTFSIFDKNQFLRLDWDKDLNYKVKMYGDGNQEDFYIALLINVGVFTSGQEKSTIIKWIDAEGTYMETIDLSGDMTEPFSVTYFDSMFYVTDATELKVYVFDDTFTYDSDWAVNAANGQPRGITTNGTHIWIVDREDNLVYRYSMTGTLQDSFAYGGANLGARGCSTNGTMIWVMDETGEEVYVFDMDGTAITNWDTSATTTTPSGVYTDGNYVWVTDRGGSLQVYKFEIDGTPNLNWPLHINNDEGTGITSNGTDFFVIDNLDDDAYVYEGGLGPEPVHTLNITDPTTSVPESVSSGDNLTIRYDFQEDGVNLTTGVLVDNVLIGGTFCSIWNETACGGTPDVCSTFVNESFCGLSGCTWTGDADVLAFVGAGSIVADASAPASVTVTCPSYVADDILIVSSYDTGGDAMTTATVGWSEIAQLNGGSDDAAWWWNRSIGSGTDGPVIESVDDDLFAICYVIRGAKTTGDPWENFTIANNLSSQTDTRTPPTMALTTLGSNRLAVHFLNINDNIVAWSTSPPPPGGDWILDDDSTSTAGTDARFTVISRNVSTASTVLPREVGELNAIELSAGLTMAFVPGSVNGCSDSPSACNTYTNSSFCGGIGGCDWEITNEEGYVAGSGWQVNITVPTFASGLKDLFLNASITSGQFNVDCYQENATDATSCGGLDTGSELIGADWVGSGVPLFDGSSSTYDLAQPALTAVAQINYTIPSDVDLSESIWTVKSDTATANLSLANCVSLEGNAVFKITSNSGAGSVTWNCWAGSAFMTLDTHASGYWVYEEGIYWARQVNITRDETQSNAINYGGVGDTCTYSSGDWIVDCSDYCNITSNVDAGGNIIVLSGTGYFNVLANITSDLFAWTPTCKILNTHGDGNFLGIAGG